MLAQMSVDVAAWRGMWSTAGAYCIWICVHCIYASAAEKTLSDYDFHRLSMLKCNRVNVACGDFVKWQK